MKMRSLFILLMTPAAAMAGERSWSAINSSPRGAIETRPIWERPAMGLSLVRETEAALDRGNGRIEDAATFELRRVARERGLLRDAASGGGTRKAFELFQEEWDRQGQIARIETRRADDTRRAKIVEVESERLAADRERWLKQLAKPRHAEAAIVDRQGK